MSALTDLILKHCKQEGATAVADRDTIEFVNILVVDDPTNGRTTVTGLERPTASQALGALAIAADTDADSDADDLGYSTKVAGDSQGLLFTTAATPAPLPTAGTIQMRASAATEADVMVLRTSVEDQRVVTNPRVGTDSVRELENTGTATTTDNSTWVDILEMPIRYSGEDTGSATQFEAEVHTTSYNVACKLWGFIESDNSLTLTYLIPGGTTLAATHANVQVVDPVSGSVIKVQVKGPAVATHTWEAHYRVVGTTY